MKFDITLAGSKGSVTASDGTSKAGEMTFSIAGEELIIIDHTEVDKNFRGKNVGQDIVLHMVDYARQNSIKIIPLCPFAKSVFQKQADIRDVLKN